MDKYTIAPPAGSTNNSVGAEDRPWKEGHFEKLVADDVVTGNVTADELITTESPYANVKAFGAKGDGVTDDTAAIQAALSSHGRVFFPFGTYIVSDTITLGWGRQILGQSYAGGTTLRMVTDGKPLLKVKDVPFAQIRNISLEGTNDWDNTQSPEEVAGSDGILLTGAGVVTLENIQIRKFKGNGLTCNRSNTATVQVTGRMLYIKNNSGCGVSITDTHGCLIVSSCIEFNKNENIEILTDTMDIEFNSINCNFSNKKVSSVISVLNYSEQDNAILKNIHIEDADETPVQRNVPAIHVNGRALFQHCYLRYPQGNYTDGIKSTGVTGGKVEINRCVFRQMENPINSTNSYVKTVDNFFYNTVNKMVGEVVNVENTFKSQSTAIWCKANGTQDIEGGFRLPYGWKHIWRAILTIVGAGSSVDSLAGKKVKLTTYNDRGVLIAENTIDMGDFFGTFWHRKSVTNLITDETQIVKITIPTATQIMDLGLELVIDAY